MMSCRRDWEYPRQQVNQICRRLQARGLVTRHKDPVRGKIVNRWQV